MRPLARVGVELSEPLRLTAHARDIVAVPICGFEFQSFRRNIAEREAACALEEQRPRDICADFFIGAAGENSLGSAARKPSRSCHHIPGVTADDL